MHDFAQKLANYVYNLQAASAVEQWEQDQYEKHIKPSQDPSAPLTMARFRRVGRAMKREQHPLNPGTGNWCDTLPKAPASTSS